MILPLYDSPADVLTKAMVAQGLPAEDLAQRAEVDREAIEQFRNGRFSDDLARRIAPPLGLAPEALAQLAEPYPVVPLPPGIERLALPFEDEHVNAWLLTDGSTPLVIDAGFGPDDLDRELEQRGICEIDLLVTHDHRDHIGGLKAVRRRLRNLSLPGRRTCPGSRLQLGQRRIRIFDLQGHHPNALGYRIDDRNQPVVMVGDAVFAGSIGGCADPRAFHAARHTIIDGLFPLAEATFLLPGHGPATTLGTEFNRNPFLAAWR